MTNYVPIFCKRYVQLHPMYLGSPRNLNGRHGCIPAADGSHGQVAVEIRVVVRNPQRKRSVNNSWCSHRSRFLENMVYIYNKYIYMQINIINK